MNATEHIAEAERVRGAALSADAANEQGFTGWSRSDLAALALVHATCAVAVATENGNRMRPNPSQMRQR